MNKYTKPIAEFTAFSVEDVITVSGVSADGVIIKDKEGKTSTIKADSVILSVGYTPTPVAEKAKNVHIIGDAKAVGNLRTVIWNAWDVAMKI